MKFFHRKRSLSIDFRRLGERLDDLATDDEQGITKAVFEEVNVVSDSASRELANIVLSDASTQVRELAKFRRGFENRLRRAWRRPLAMYETIQALCWEIGSDLNTAYGPEAASRQDSMFEALTRLHGRACLTASEVGALLRSGHATGANARWRTLHELAVVSMFIAEKGQDVARRYLDHDIVARSRGALQYQEHAERLGAEPLTLEEIELARQMLRELVERYGPGYDSDYGWAAQALGRKKPRFSDLSAAIDLRHWAPYMRLASDAVHAGPHGAFFDIGLHPSIDAIPAGPSHFGLADPGGNALISLHQVTVTLMAHYLKTSTDQTDKPLQPTFREQTLNVIKMKTLQIMVDRADEAFVATHKQQEVGSPYAGEAPRVLDISA